MLLVFEFFDSMFILFFLIIFELIWIELKSFFLFLSWFLGLLLLGESDVLLFFFKLGFGLFLLLKVIRPWLKSPFESLSICGSIKFFILESEVWYIFILWNECSFCFKYSFNKFFISLSVVKSMGILSYMFLASAWGSFVKRNFSNST